MPINKQQPAEYCLIKQRLSAIQKRIKLALKEDRLPQADVAARFIATSKEMKQLSPDSWQKEVDNYMECLAQFQAALDGTDVSTIKATFQKLLDCKISCHKAFRQK